MVGIHFWRLLFAYYAVAPSVLCVDHWLIHLSVFQDKDWDTSVQFLPASDNKKLEKKKGPGKVGAVIGVVIFAAVIALMTGLLVWHFHCKNNFLGVH